MRLSLLRSISIIALTRTFSSALNRTASKYIWGDLALKRMDASSSSPSSSSLFMAPAAEEARGSAREDKVAGGEEEGGKGRARGGGGEEENEEDDGNLACDVVSWLERIKISSAKSRKVKGGNYVQIATVDAEGKPTCRTVVFRGFVELEAGGESWMKMITDARSEKVAHVAASPACEMVWWFSKTSEQYRISGNLHLIGPSSSSSSTSLSEQLQNARLQQWNNLSDPAREQFYWKQPGVSFTPLTQGQVPAGGRDVEGKLLAPSENFLLMLLEPRSVKYLRLRDNFAQLDVRSSSKSEERGSSWTSERVNP